MPADTTQPAPEMPPLPEPAGNAIVISGDQWQSDYTLNLDAFDEDQMRTYARAHAAALTQELASVRAERDALSSDALRYRRLIAVALASQQEGKA